MLPQSIFVVPWSDVFSPSSPSRFLSSLVLHLSMLDFLGPFLVTWALGFPKVVFPPALPLLLLFFLALPG
jgi:hypothetical protein